MGRRIPGKKHRGVKDPLVQKEIREKGLKHLINAPPKDIDVQEIPKSLERLMKLKQMTKEGVFNKQKKKNRDKNVLMDTSKLAGKERILPGMTKPDRELPVLMQRPGEPDAKFLHRVKSATNRFIKHVDFELEHNMKMKVDKKTGQVSFEKVEMDPVDKMFQDKLMATKGHKRKKNMKGVALPVGLSKTARRRLRQQAKKADRDQEVGCEQQGKVDDFSRLQDKVEFNEIVHRPPHLSSLPRRIVADDVARRPGSKPGLLLAQLLEPSGKMNKDLTGRRKDLPESDRRRLDSAQAAAVQAYRQIKAARVTVTDR